MSDDESNDSGNNDDSVDDYIDSSVDSYVVNAQQFGTRNLYDTPDTSDDSDPFGSDSDSDTDNSDDDVGTAHFDHEDYADMMNPNSRRAKRAEYEHYMFKELCKKYDCDFEEQDDSVYACEHYKSLCRIVCPTCPDDDNVFSCHKCHNVIMLERDLTEKANRNKIKKEMEEKDRKEKKEGSKSIKKVKDDSDSELNQNLNKVSQTTNVFHELVSSEIEKIVCIKCDHKQKFRRECEKCGTRFASYICFKCRLMDNKCAKFGSSTDGFSASKNYFHCSDCGCCLVGKRRNYKHCSSCGVCVQKSMFERHPCRKGSLEADRLCSICQSGIRTQTSVIMRCGHVVHQDCYNTLIKATYKCPECQKSITDTKKIFTRMSREIELTPLHPELQKRVTINCNDCGTRSEVDYHYIGNRCSNKKCRSFNTYEV
ncbi:CHY zinc finger domain-containing protein [Yasminevirus sp. GU-2018]|uniref:CHY zinc finger domain-containing protein n=1 Tax=Yasminevirus sp. GU-2018 TaxID=2420051 RepID=A0A5K0U9T0_9VIRU|nr:CHY zinc finger domain-containing protein [Yasminevirus sp. GU-2018]